MTTFRRSARSPRKCSFVPYRLTTMLLSTPLALGVHAVLAQQPVEELIVVGERVIQSRSLDRKRNAASIVEVVTTDGIRALPDGNPAEALRRLPGVYALDDQGEGRYVSVRGIDPELMNVTLNGQPVGSPEGGGSGGSTGRAVRMDSIPAELVSGIEVVKAVTPDMDHNAIGGGINISTASPFDREGVYHFGRMAYGTNDSSGDPAWSASGTYGTKLGPEETWGILVSGSYEERTIASQRMSSDAWQPIGDLFLPSELSLFDYLVDRERWGTNVALEHRPNEDHTLKIDLSYNRHSDDEDRNLVRNEFRLGTASEQTDTTGRYSQGRVTREYRWYMQQDTIATASVAGEHFFGNSQLDWSAGYSLAEKNTPRRVDWEFRSGTGTFPNSYDLSPPLYRVFPDDHAAYMDPDNYPFRRLRRRTDLEREEIYSLQANLRRDITLGDRTAYWKTGASTTLRDKLQDRSNENYVVGQPFALGDFDLSTPDIPGFFDGYYRFGPALDISSLERFFVENPDYFVPDDESTILNSTGDDYDGSEDVLAVYGMVGVELGNVDLLGGVRVERTQAEYRADEIFYEDGSFTGQIRRLSDSNRYTNVFPGLHVRWNATDRFVLRGSWTTTIGRQPFGSLSPARTFSVIEGVEPGTLTGSVSEGNPNLEPYDSRNYDLSFEFYPEAGGIYSVALFRKEIDNAIYTYSYEEENVDFAGFNFERLSFSRPENADAGRIQGLELNVQRFFDFLPEPFDGFGVGLNYTYAKSSLKVDTRPGETLPYVRQPREIGNVALMYEKNKISARIAMTYAGSYLTGISSGVETDPYRYRRKPVDARFSYQFTPKVSAFLNLRNITDEPDENYSGRPERRTAHEFYSWSAWMGVNWRL